MVYKEPTGDHTFIIKYDKLPIFGATVPNTIQTSPIEDFETLTKSRKPWYSTLSTAQSAEYVKKHVPLAKIKDKKLQIIADENDPYIKIRP